MNHIEYDQWVKYVRNNLDDETRETYEKHMFTCECCLDLYVKAVESHNYELPKLTDDVTDKIVEYVSVQTKQTKKEQKTQSKVKNSFFNYIIAAAMTLILMSSGLFGHLIQVTSNFEAKSASEQNQSLTEQLVDKTVNLIQVFERNKEVK